MLYLALLFLIMALGPAVFADTMVLTDRADVLLYFEHHYAVHVQCRTDARLQRIIKKLAGSGFPLPTRPPDGTFKPVAWMEQQADIDASGA